MLPYFSEYYGNASTIYSLGAESKKAMDHARRTIADSLGAKPEENAEYMAPHRSQRLQKFFGCSCMNEDPGKDNKRKKRGKQGVQPQLQAISGSG